MAALRNVVDLFPEEFLVDGAHVDSVSEALHLELSLLLVVISLDLLLQFRVEHVLRLPLPVHLVLHHFLVFLGAKMNICDLLNVISVNFPPEFVHLDLLLENLAYRLLLLPAFHLARHHEPVIFFFQGLAMALSFIADYPSVKFP